MIELVMAGRMTFPDDAPDTPRPNSADYKPTTTSLNGLVKGRGCGLLRDRELVRLAVAKGDPPENAFPPGRRRHVMKRVLARKAGTRAARVITPGSLGVTITGPSNNGDLNFRFWQLTTIGVLRGTGSLRPDGRVLVAYPPDTQPNMVRSEETPRWRLAVYGQ